MNLKNQIELELYFADHFDTILFPALANIYLEQGDLKRAKKVCDIGLGHHENDSAGLFILAQIEKANGNLKEAEKALEHVLLYSKDHLAAAKMLCEIQTVLGRASSRLVKSWKHVLTLEPTNKTAQDFIKKVESGTANKPTKQILKPQREPLTKKSLVRKREPDIELMAEPSLDAEPLPIQPDEPLQVSSRLATFTLVAVLKNQGLFHQALEVLDALEAKGESPESITLEREVIQTLISKSIKD
jgi:tetratricopeptide (TPR) repeat protein